MRKSKSQDSRLITHTMPKSPIAEAYRTLRTNIGFTEMDHHCKSIMVTSPNPQDGKSTVTANLAVVLAQAGHKVILADCDLRKPTVHSTFGLDNSRGFTNALVQKMNLDEIIRPGPIENLAILTSGPIPPNPSELLNSNQTLALWKTLKEKYDYVIIDSPPVIAVADASILAAQVDGAILVLKEGTKNEAALMAKEQLEKANVKILGAVLNQVKISKSDYHYYYYYARTGDEKD